MLYWLCFKEKPHLFIITHNFLSSNNIPVFGTTLLLLHFVIAQQAFRVMIYLHNLTVSDKVGDLPVSCALKIFAENVFRDN